MMKKILTTLCLLFSIAVYAQNYRLKTGDIFPDITFRPVVNAPFAAVDLKNRPDKKFYIIDFWGTWCTPCIPQIERLAKLQKQFSNEIQIIGVSNDSKEKLQKFIKTRPLKIWLASDQADFLYQLADVNSVDQCMIVDGNKKIIGFYQTESVNAKMIAGLLKGKVTSADAAFKGRPITTLDEFGADSTTQNSVTLRGYMLNHQSMGRQPTGGPYARRRVSYFNITLPFIYKQLYKLGVEKQLVLEKSVEKYDNYKDNNLLYCFDVIVPRSSSDSLLFMARRALNKLSPLKTRIEERPMDVYLLKNKNFTASKSQSTTPSISFSGNGYDGQGVLVKDFAEDYLTNELEIPVVDETGLAGRYDIKTDNDVRTKQNVLKAVEKLGLTLEKAERKIKVVVLSEK